MEVFGNTREPTVVVGTKAMPNFILVIRSLGKGLSTGHSLPRCSVIFAREVCAMPAISARHHRRIRITIGAGIATVFALCGARPRLRPGEDRFHSIRGRMRMCLETYCGRRAVKVERHFIR
jgi:hypothetical protein